MLSTMSQPASANSLSRRFTALLAVSVATVLGAGCSVGDQLCPEGTNLRDRDDDCPYGEQLGPRIEKAGCPPVQQKTDCAGAPVWTTDVFPILDNAAGARCTTESCHGGANPPKIGLPAGDAAQSYSALTGYTSPAAGGAYYVDKGDASKSWILCNISGDKRLGSAMPIGAQVGAAELQTIQDWLSCGAKSE
jgi:hypothetical protein